MPILVISGQTPLLEAVARSDQTDRTIQCYFLQQWQASNGVTLIQRKIIIDMRTMERAVLRASRTTCPSLSGVAKAMHMSPRTLQRLLMEQGTTFSQVLERSRRETAIQLLVEEDLSLSDIARMLGYSDPSNFGRAVRKWAGQSPRQWRKALLRERRPGLANRTR